MEGDIRQSGRKVSRQSIGMVLCWCERRGARCGDGEEQRERERETEKERETDENGSFPDNPDNPVDPRLLRLGRRYGCSAVQRSCLLACRSGKWREHPASLRLGVR